MVMVAHQDVCVNQPAGFLARLAQGFQKALAIFIVVEDRLAVASASHNMVDGARVLGNHWLFSSWLIFIHTDFRCHFSMSQRPFLAPLSFVSPVSFNLSQLARIVGYTT